MSIAGGPFDIMAADLKRDGISDPDGTAAAALAVHAHNDDAPKVTSPAASPGYLEVEFVADPTQTYKLWVRLKADVN